MSTVAVGHPVPETLRGALASESLARIESALAPPVSARIAGRYELEIEAAGEGTFVVAFDEGEISARKGFAEDEPFLAFALPPAGWTWLRPFLQAALDGFPAAPEVHGQVQRMRALTSAQQESMVRALRRLRDAGVDLRVDGVGAIRVARGAVDEVTRTLTVALPEDAMAKVLRGAGATVLAELRFAGDMRLGTELLSCLAPLLSALEPASSR